MAPGTPTLCGGVSWKGGSGEETWLSAWFRVSKPGLRAQPPLIPQVGRQEMDRPQRGALFLLVQTRLHDTGHRARAPSTVFSSPSCHGDAICSGEKAKSPSLPNTGTQLPTPWQHHWGPRLLCSWSLHPYCTAWQLSVPPPPSSIACHRLPSTTGPVPSPLSLST